MPSFEPIDLARTYVHLRDGAEATPIDVDEDFWSALPGRAELHDGRLLVVTREEKDWPTWEMHPAGDEVVVLLSGSADLVLEIDCDEHVVPLRGRGAVIVPQGVWHRMIVRERGEVLFVTRGAGTRHRPVALRAHASG